MAEKLVISDLNLNKNQLKNPVLHTSNEAPSNPVRGQVYYDTEADLIGYFDGSTWIYPDTNIYWIENGVVGDETPGRILHLDTLEDATSARFSTLSTNDYIVTVDNMVEREGVPTVLYNDICYIKLLGIIYTHGQFYIADFLADSYQYSGSIYGVQWDTNNPSPECTRIGNLSNHITLPVQSQLIGGVMTDAGVFTPFDNQNDWTQATQKRDGSDGQVMVKIPSFYIRYETSGTINRVLMSDTPCLGFKQVPEMYISAYEATVDRDNGNKLCSVANKSARYRGGNNQSAWDSEDTKGYGGESHRSQLGRPATNINLTNFRAYARLRGSNKWNCMTYEAQKILTWLYVVEYATLNTQKAFDSSLTTEGYHKGGLGNGITTWDGTSWSNFNGYYPLVPCGWTDEYGNRTIVKSYTVYNSDGSVAKAFLTSDSGVSGVPRYRGIESPFGHIWQWTDGVLVNVTSTTSPIYVCYDPSKFSSSLTDDYEYIGDECRFENYFTKITFGENGDTTASSTSAIGSSTTFYCDRHYTNTSTFNLRGLHFGGYASAGAAAGLFCSSSSATPSSAGANVGSRLLFRP